MDTSNILSSFLKAARPEWTVTQLAAVEEKLEKVGIHDVLELIQSLRGPSEQRLNNRLKAVGEKCFTSETLSALRRRVREEPALRRAAEQPAANARLAAASSYPTEEQDSGDSSTAELLAAPKWNPAAAARAKMASSKAPGAPMPTSKEDMLMALENLGLEVKKCHVRDMRAILFEARRLQELRREDLLQEVRKRQMLPADVTSSSEAIIRHFLELTFPESLETHDDASNWTREHSEPSPRSSADEDGFTFQILTPSPEPLSLSTLFTNSEEELLRQCKARGLWTDGMESKGKGFFALLLKLDSRREYLQSLQDGGG